MMPQCRAVTRWLALSIGLVAASAVVAEEVQLKHDGLQLNGELELADGKSPADGLIVMTHGTLAHARMEIMRGLQNTFKEYGFNTLAINLGLGQDNRHGMYDCGSTHTHKHTDALEEIGAWLEWAKQEGAKEIVLLGHSRGGNQTAWFAAERDVLGVKAVVLIAPMTWNEEYARTDYHKRYGQSLDDVLAEARQLVKQGKGDTVMKNVDFIYCEDADVTAESFVSYYAADPRRDTPGLLPKIEEPVLVIVGSEDKVVKGLEEKVDPLADGQRVRMMVIDGADHMFRDLYLYDIVEGVQAFLEARD